MKEFANRSVGLTLAFVVVLLAVVLVRKDPALISSWTAWIRNETAPASRSPEDAIYAMLDAERAGDTKAYLDAFSGPIHDRLQQVIKEESPAKFGSYLVRNADFQGVAITVTGQPTEDEVRARVEYVYGDRNEVQKLQLERHEGRWRIVQVAGAESIRSLFPFDSAVTDWP